MVSRIVRSALAGFVAGSIATFVMSRGFNVAQSVGAITELPPRRAVRVVSPQITEPNRSVVATIAHYLVGGGAAALYGAGTSVRPRSRGALTGMLFGLGVWAVGYEFLMPTATGMPLAHHDRRPRAVAILVAHVIYGLSLGMVSKSMTSKDER
jgi:hypothetical protein